MPRETCGEKRAERNLLRETCLRREPDGDLHLVDEALAGIVPERDEEPRLLAAVGGQSPVRGQSPLEQSTERVRTYKKHFV